MSTRLSVHLIITFKWEIVTSEIAQMVERLRRMQEVAGSNLTFFSRIHSGVTTNNDPIENLTLVSFRKVLFKNNLFKMFMTGVLCTVCGAQVYLCSKVRYLFFFWCNFYVSNWEKAYIKDLIKF